MSDGRLSFYDGEVFLGYDVLPGILKSQSVGGRVRFDEVEQDDKSGSAKIPMGWEDSDITLEVELLTEPDSSCYDKLARLNRFFKGTDNDKNPNVYEVDNAHLIARGVDQVVFSGLSSKENDQDDVILATLAFTEHIPITIDDARVNAPGSAGAPATTAGDPGLSKTLTGDLDP